MILSNQYIWEDGWVKVKGAQMDKPQLGLIFGSRPELEKYGEKAIAQLKKKYASITTVTTSTAGNILGDQIKYNSIIATCIEFEKTDLVFKSFKTNDIQERELGEKIANSFEKKNLASVILFATASINAGNLVDGLNLGFKNGVPVSGGVAGDGLRFEKTFVGIDKIEENNCVAIGLYSESLAVSYGSKGGWRTFGPPRKVTKSKGNILYEIDDMPVLDLYKEYLGTKAKDLPASGLLFPFAIVDQETNGLIVRGIQNIDEKNQSIILYGDIKNGQILRLMRANQSVLIDGAGESAKDALNGLNNQKPQLAILVSCVARRLALDQLIEEETEEVQEILGESTTICGFYSYSEISPLKDTVTCSLHNQTMTITAISEL